MGSASGEYASLRYLGAVDLEASGVAPDEINKVVTWHSKRLWRSVDGEVKADEFERVTREKSEDGGPAYTPGPLVFRRK